MQSPFRFNKVSKTLKTFNYTGHALLGMALLCNMKISSILTYYWHGNFVDQSEIEKIRKEIFGFIWKTTEWIKRNTLYLPRREGGLVPDDLAIRNKALKLKHTHDVVNNKQKAVSKWAQLFLPTHLRNREMTVPPILLMADFYKHTLENLKEIQRINPNFLSEKSNSKATYAALRKAKCEIPTIREKHPNLTVDDVENHCNSKINSAS